MMLRILGTAPLFLAAAIAVAARTPRVIDPEAERVALVAHIERSVAIISVTAREVRHSRFDSAVILEQGSALGTGALLSHDGVVLTAAHVVQNATEVSVRFIEGDDQRAEVIFSDDSADIALLRVASVPPGAVPATLGDSDAVRKGQNVYIVGNPVGVEFSLSSGIVSGRHSTSHVFGGTVDAEKIQTDAAMNAGNSGGPMFNGRGEVIAIAQQILSRSGGSEGLGFGLAINVVKELLAGDPCLWLGFSAVALDSEWTSALNVPQPDALLIQNVFPGSPAANAGLRDGNVPVQFGETHFLLGGDIILGVDGTPISQWTRRNWHDPAEGDKHQIVLSILRGGRTMDVPIETIHHNSLVGALALKKEVGQ